MIPPDPLAIAHDRTADLPGVRWLRLHTAPWAVQSARRFAIGLLREEHVTGALADDVALATSELVTNALNASLAYARNLDIQWAHTDTPVHVGLHVAGRWAHLLVRDPDPAMAPPPEDHDALDESGRGLGIVAALADEIWYTSHGWYKVVHALVRVTEQPRYCRTCLDTRIVINLTDPTPGVVTEAPCPACEP